MEPSNVTGKDRVRPAGRRTRERDHDRDDPDRDEEADENQWCPS